MKIKTKTKQKQKKKITFIINAVFPPFFPISNIFSSKETLQYKETYEEGTSYFFTTRDI